MFVFKIIRKIGKILRGGAGRKEIVLGTLCGVLIGFNPVAGLTLVLAILITLLLNANVAFTLLGVALGKVLSLILAPLSFHTGYFIIHNMGMENLFASLANAPFTALMHLDVYAMIGGLPYAIIIGLIFGVILGKTVTKIREKMLEAEQHEIIGKTVGKKITRFLLWLAFGKQKLSLEDMITKQSPLLRKSGLILVGSVIVIGIALEVALLDMLVKSGLQSAIRSGTGAEVNIAKAHLSLTDGSLELEGLQITDPDKPTHNFVQIDALSADISVSDLLRDNYVVELLAGSTLKRDTLRAKPGRVYAKEGAQEERAEEPLPGKPLEDYFANAQTWKKYGEKAYDYLKKRKTAAEAAAKGEKPVASKKDALANARNIGYLKASANLVVDRPAWTVRQIKIDDVQLGGDFPAHRLEGSELSSHPELNGKPIALALMPEEGTEATASVLLRVDASDAPHALSANLVDMAMADAIEPSDDFPLDLQDGKVDFKTDGKFSANELALPFTVLVRDLKARAEEGQEVLGMDAATANEVFSSIEQLEIEGVLSGSLRSPRVSIDYDKLTASMKEALVAAGKKELSKRADKEMDKAKDAAKEELDKAMNSEEAEDLKGKASDAIKGLF